jgi:16S rRNA (guanine527-N7)-methyltransferase
VTGTSEMSLILPNVSRETLERLAELQKLVEKWTTTINLVAKSTLPNIFMRHIVDSAQIYKLAPNGAKSWADLGSGGGFPGLVIASIAADENPTLMMTLVESDLRKATFLRHATRSLGLQADVRSDRIETMSRLGTEIVSARALAPLAQLCAFSQIHLANGGLSLFHKGANHENEIKIAQQDWRFQLTKIQSITDPSAVILKIEGLSHV